MSVKHCTIFSTYHHFFPAVLCRACCTLSSFGSLKALLLVSLPSLLLMTDLCFCQCVYILASLIAEIGYNPVKEGAGTSI